MCTKTAEEVELTQLARHNWRAKRRIYRAIAQGPRFGKDAAKPLPGLVPLLFEPSLRKKHVHCATTDSPCISDIASRHPPLIRRIFYRRQCPDISKHTQAAAKSRAPPCTTGRSRYMLKGTLTAKDDDITPRGRRARQSRHAEYSPRRLRAKRIREGQWGGRRIRGERR